MLCGGRYLLVQLSAVFTMLTAEGIVLPSLPSPHTTQTQPPRGTYHQNTFVTPSSPVKSDAAATPAWEVALAWWNAHIFLCLINVFDLISGQRQKSSQDKSRNKEDAFFTVCLTCDNAAAWGHSNKGAAKVCLGRKILIELQIHVVRILFCSALANMPMGKS